MSFWGLLSQDKWPQNRADKSRKTGYSKAGTNARVMNPHTCLASMTNPDVDLVGPIKIVTPTNLRQYYISGSRTMTSTPMSRQPQTFNQTVDTTGSNYNYPKGDTPSSSSPTVSTSSSFYTPSTAKSVKEEYGTPDQYSPEELSDRFNRIKTEGVKPIDYNVVTIAPKAEPPSGLEVNTFNGSISYPSVPKHSPTERELADAEARGGNILYPTVPELSPHAANLAYHGRVPGFFPQKPDSPVLYPSSDLKEISPVNVPDSVPSDMQGVINVGGFNIRAPHPSPIDTEMKTDYTTYREVVEISSGSTTPSTPSSTLSDIPILDRLIALHPNAPSLVQLQYENAGKHNPFLKGTRVKRPYMKARPSRNVPKVDYYESPGSAGSRSSGSEFVPSPH